MIFFRKTTQENKLPIERDLLRGIIDDLLVYISRHHSDVLPSVSEREMLDVASEAAKPRRPSTHSRRRHPCDVCKKLTAHVNRRCVVCDAKAGVSWRFGERTKERIIYRPHSVNDCMLDEEMEVQKRLASGVNPWAKPEVSIEDLLSGEEE